ncbi:MAG: hypothetical protein WC859_08995 [Elusimicrobiota bacterium]
MIETNWLATLVGGGLLWAVSVFLARRTTYFHQPYDFGRCFSLGAIVGSLTQMIGSLIQFPVQFHQFPTWFRLGGALISGCLTGGIVSSFFLWCLSIANPAVKSSK